LFRGSADKLHGREPSSETSAVSRESNLRLRAKIAKGGSSLSRWRLFDKEATDGRKDCELPPGVGAFWQAAGKQLWPVDKRIVQGPREDATAV
jgi:hypothetical protein